MQRSETGLGYVCYRDRTRGYDHVVYEHQLVALLDTPAEEVFAEDTHVHHENRIRLDNRRENLTVIEERSHAALTNRVRADGGETTDDRDPEL